jgi:glyoxylase-like metal-dependent hydrolase (beta-lactamase superfamily II)
MQSIAVGTRDWRMATLTVGPLMMNAYLVWSDSAGEAALIDPGDEAERLLEAIDATGCRLSLLLCTHGHFDHVSAAAGIQTRWDLPILHHPDDAFLFEGLNEIRSGYGFPPVFAPRRADLPVAPLPFAGAEIDVAHVPGHCPGHVMFGFGRDAVVGDVIFRESIGRTDLPGGDFDVLAASIRDEVYSLNDETVLHPGHGPITSVGHEKAANPFVR